LLQENGEPREREAFKMGKKDRRYRRVIIPETKNSCTLVCQEPQGKGGEARKKRGGDSERSQSWITKGAFGATFAKRSEK